MGGSKQELLLKESLQFSKEMLKKHHETLKVDEIRKDTQIEIPNYEKIKANLDVCDQINSIFEKTSIH